jgi:hypothetical protein
MTGNTYLSILILNVDGLNSPIERHRIVSWFKKQDQAICCLWEIHVTGNDNELEWKGGKRSEQTDPRKSRSIYILVSDKTDFRWKLVRRDSEVHFILIKGTLHQEEIKFLYVHQALVCPTTF